MTNFDPLAHPRAVAGKFVPASQSAPECTLAVDVDALPPARRKPAKGKRVFISFAEARPELVSEWSVAGNNGVLPTEVSCRSIDKYAWICGSCGHEWSARVAHRTDGVGCPPCARKRLAALLSAPRDGDSLAEMNPELIVEWHPTRNGSDTPFTVRAGSSSLAWWMCSLGHEWDCVISTRTRGFGSCSTCERARTGTQLISEHPVLSVEWHPTANLPRLAEETLTVNQTRASWQCADCGFEWKATPHSRNTGGSPCEQCHMLRNSFAAVRPDLTPEWHSTKNGANRPDEVLANSTEYRWWQCAACDHEWSAIVKNRTKGHGCKLCGRLQGALTKSTPSEGNSLQDRFPEIAAEWHPTRNGTLTPSDVNHGSASIAWWQCASGHEWDAQISYRTISGRICPKCRPEALGHLSVAECPELMEEWHPTRNGDLDPRAVLSTGGQMVWWLCKACGHEWPTRAVQRSTMGNGCIKCAAAARGVQHRVPLAGRSFEDVYPDLSLLWDYDRNDKGPSEHNANSADKAHFICVAGHNVHVRLYTCADGALSCRRCSRSGTSRWEEGVRGTLTAAGFPVDMTTSTFKQRTSGRTWRPDIVLPSWKLIVELDGFYWHGSKKALDKDRRKNADFESWGWTVVRVRAGLPSISPNDLVLSSTSPSVEETLVALKDHLLNLGYDPAAATLVLP